MTPAGADSTHNLEEGSRPEPGVPRDLPTLPEGGAHCGAGSKQGTLWPVLLHGSIGDTHTLAVCAPVLRSKVLLSNRINLAERHMALPGRPRFPEPVLRRTLEGGEEIDLSFSVFFLMLDDQKSPD